MDGLRGQVRGLRERSLPAPEPCVRIAYLDAPIALAELAGFHAGQGALGVEGERPPRWAMYEGEVVVSKRHFWEGESERGLEGIALGRVGDGGARRGDEPVVNLDRARVGRL